MDQRTIAIIGGGACGVAAFIELVIQLKISELHRNVKIVIIEPCAQIGVGLAFGTKQPGHLLNTQADLMGIHTTEPAHYSKWLQANKKEVHEEIKGIENPDDAYSTRRLYSDYLQEQFNHYYKIAQTEGMQIEIVHDEAINFYNAAGLWTITLSNHPVQRAEFVILVPGTPKPINYPHLDGIENYIDFPWPSKPILTKIHRDDEVGILGSSLSAIDAVMTLSDNNHKGKIILYSADGLLPRVQSKEDTEYKRDFLKLSAIHKIIRENLRSPKITELFRLFQQEAEQYSQSKINWKETGRIGKSAKSFIEQDIKAAESGDDAFINILYSLRYEASTIWSWLSIEEKKIFKHWLGNYFTTNRHCMPLENARNIKELFNDGKLEVRPKLKEVTYDESSRKFLIEHGKGEIDKLSFIINATGPGNKVEEMNSELIQNLYKSGIIEPYEIGGIKIDPGSMEVMTSEPKNKNLYAAGHICNGMLMDVNSVWYNVKTISILCQNIIKKISYGCNS